MRYILKLSYKGTDFSGWQRQDNAISVQELVEEKLSLKLQEEIQVIGCGRTDAGVHASDYTLHFDTIKEVPEDLHFALNQLLPESIAIKTVRSVNANFHARFDASSRSYIYHIHALKDPFKNELSYYFPRMLKVDRKAMQDLVEKIVAYDSFAPFCKSNSDVKTMRCQLKTARWVFDDADNSYRFYISSDRFLRGMVRLIVGACLQVGLSKMSMDDVLIALDKQEPLPAPWSVPPEGLFLSQVKY